MIINPPYPPSQIYVNIFERPINREDGSDFDDFWTKRIVSSQSIFLQIIQTDEMDENISKNSEEIFRKKNWKIFKYVSYSGGV